MTATTFTVEGMTCEHCVEAVSGELSKLPGVEHVDVDLASGRVEVTSTGPIEDAALRAAVDEAGYVVSS
jgi:copper chaperone CopZ